MSDLNQITTEILGAFKDAFRDMFDREEDLEALKPIAIEMAGLRLQILTGSAAEQEDARRNLIRWENVAKLRIMAAGLRVKTGLDYVLEKMLGIAARLLAAV